MKKRTAIKVLRKQLISTHRYRWNTMDSALRRLNSLAPKFSQPLFINKRNCNSWGQAMSQILREVVAQAASNTINPLAG
jgi:hypothetical protein